MICSGKMRDFEVLRAVCSACVDTTARLGRCRNRNQLSHPHQVVSRRCEGENPRHLEQAAMFQFAQQRDVLHPAEALFDAFSLLLTGL